MLANLKDGRNYGEEIAYLNYKQICSAKIVALFLEKSIGASVSHTVLFVCKFLISLRTIF